MAHARPIPRLAPVMNATPAPLLLSAAPIGPPLRPPAVPARPVALCPSGSSPPAVRATRERGRATGAGRASLYGPGGGNRLQPEQPGGVAPQHRVQLGRAEPVAER